MKNAINMSSVITLRPDKRNIPGLALNRLTVRNFRCYDTARLDIPASDGPHSPVLLVGPNGAGKTNILEAISFLTPGRGLRCAKIADVTRVGAEGPWGVAAGILRPEGLVEAGTGPKEGATDEDEALDGDFSTIRRTARIDGKRAGPAALRTVASVNWMTPQMDRIFIDGTASRRRFLDRLVLGLHPDHSRTLNAYEKAMRDRLRLLVDRHDSADAAWLTALEAQMAEYAIAVAAARLDAVSHLAGYVAARANGLWPGAGLAIEGVIEHWLSTLPALEVEERFCSVLKANRSQDGLTGRTVDGVHRSDFRITHLEKRMAAEMCSTGEQKALLTGLILASVRLEAETTGLAPLLLLDEVVAHLDEERRQALFEEVCSFAGQVWLTGTDLSLFKPILGRAVIFYVENAAIRPAAKTQEPPFMTSEGRS